MQNLDDKLADTEFSAVINSLGGVTVTKKVRDLFDINTGDEIILEFKGKVSKRIMKPKDKTEVEKDE